MKKSQLYICEYRFCIVVHVCLLTVLKPNVKIKYCLNCLGTTQYSNLVKLTDAE